MIFLAGAVYTKSQVGVMTVTLATIVGIMLGHGFAWLQGFASPFWKWFMLFCLLLPLYIKLVRQAFLSGIARALF
ncbi:MAG: hypothetical protein NWF08_03395 [Candidatus Bathyarchaeota archaeon]|nr:hypothetical protein [Candidatus Bathyarchaeota archaeon]